MREFVDSVFPPSYALFWPSSDRAFSKLSKNQYHTCFKTVSELDITGTPIHMIESIEDIKTLWEKYPDISLCIPVFSNSHGWWFPLTQTNRCPSPQITSKIIASPECIIYIAKCQKTKSDKPLMVAEIKPESKFFEKLPRESVHISDMLPTSHGTILTLMQTLNPKKVMKTIRETDNFFHGILGTTL